MLGLDKFGGIGLHRIQKFFDTQAIDLARLAQRSVVITGTNGKGSTAHLTAAALGAHGLKVGVFTSPHMFDLHERFQLDGAQITSDMYGRLSAIVRSFNDSLPEGDRLGAFQFLYLVAILWFEETRPDAIVWEAGIGGRYDPVRMARARFGAVTSVELEHTEVLGGTEELIAYDKVDAVAPGGVVHLSPVVPPQLHDRLQVYCSLAGRGLVDIRAAQHIRRMTNSANGAAFTLAGPEGERDIQLSMIGRHQALNAVTAAALARAWLDANDHRFDADAAWKALGAVQVPGRLQRISDDPSVWIDVGHTPAAVAGVIQSFSEVSAPQDTIAVFGVSASKDVEGIAKLVAQTYDDVILTQAHKSGADPQRLAPYFEQASKRYTIAADITEAAALARDRASADGKPVLALGGLFLAAEFQVAWDGGDPSQLQFL